MFLAHTFIFAVVPILFLYSQNQDQARFTDLLLPLGISLGFALLLLCVLRLALKDWRAAAVVTSATLVLFYTYGRLVESLGGSVAIQVVVAVFYLAVLAAVCLVAARRKAKLKKPTKIVNVVAVTLAALTLAGIVFNASGPAPDVSARKSEVTEAISTGRKPPESELPDIYYIILDGYASNSSLREFYGFDNSDFTEALENEGFYIAESSHSNYLQTRLSLASSLNLEYVNFLTEELGKGSNRAAVPNAMIEDNGLQQFLASRGYEFAFFGSNWSGARDNRNADVSITEGSGLKGEFMVALMKTTALRGLIAEEEGLYTREGVLRAFSLLPTIHERLDGPAFVFAHIVPPHRPFLFDRDGSPAENPSNSWKDTDKYIDQLIFVNRKVLSLVDEILDNSDRPPVVVIQADHGPMPVGNPEDIGNPDARKARLRSGILNAIMLPDGQGSLYGSMTPVNTFRIVLNELFETDFVILEDRVYASSYRRPYDFVDITDLVSAGGDR